MVFEQKKSTTLGAVLEAVCSRRGVTDLELWGFRYLGDFQVENMIQVEDAVESAPMLKLSTRLTEVTALTVKLVKREVPK